MKQDFLTAFKQNIENCSGNEFRDNWDEARFGPEKEFGRPNKGALYKLKQLAKRLLATMGLYRLDKPGVPLLGDYAEQFQWIYQRLVDAESRNWMIQVLSYRALGYRRVKLPTNNARFWSARERAERLAANSETIALGWKGRNLYKMDVSSFGYDIELFFVPSGAACLFDMRHYDGRLSDAVIKVDEGDIVIDGGACWGDSSLYFAHEVGEAGKVYSFEFMPSNLEIFERNMSLNPKYSRRIDLVRKPLWSRSGEPLFVEGDGPGARVVPDSRQPGTLRVETLTIDDLVDEEDLPRVDFIKMDIEGAELEALRGAKNTLQQFRPKLAISVYHKLNDIWEIPQYIDSCGLEYKFFLRHFSLHGEETVLFAY